MSADGVQAQIHVGDRFTQVVVDDLTRTQLAMYAGASGDYHPFHHDDVFARAKGYPGVFAHGMLTMGLTGKLLTDVFGDGALVRYAADFTATVWPGDTLTATATVDTIEVLSQHDRRAHLRIETLDQDHRVVLRGSATVRLHVGDGEG
ncbi:MAG: hypothetical protein KDB21_16410 [Acidimicrobiales bacterium]|nr:hypothetical protein [Acidimicrobiales bacterium]